MIAARLAARRKPAAQALALLLAVPAALPAVFLAGCTLSALPAAPVASLGNGTLIVLNKSDNTAALLDALTGDQLVVLPTGVGPHEVAVSPDGTQAVVANYGGSEPGHTLTVLELSASRVGDTIELGKHGLPHGIQYTRNGRQLVVTSEQSGSLLLVDLAARRVLRAVPTGQDISHMVVLAPTGQRAYVANIGSGSVSVVDLSAGKVVRTLPTGAGSEGLDLTPDGKELWVANRADDTLAVIDTARLEIVAHLPCGRFPIRVKITPDGRRALVSNADSGDVAVFDVSTREEIARIPMELTAIESTDGRIFGAGAFPGSPVPVGLLVSRDGTRAWVASTNADILTVLDLQKLEVAGRIKTGREPDGLGYTALKPTGR